MLEKKIEGNHVVYINSKIAFISLLRIVFNYPKINFKTTCISLSWMLSYYPFYIVEAWDSFPYLLLFSLFWSKLKIACISLLRKVSYLPFHIDETWDSFPYLLLSFSHFLQTTHYIWMFFFFFFTTWLM